MAEILGFGEASTLFRGRKQELTKKRIYRSVESLLSFSEGLTRSTLALSAAFNGNVVALGLTDLIAARVKNPDEVFKNMLGHFEEIGIISEVNTDSLRYKSAVCLSIYLQKQIGYERSV